MILRKYADAPELAVELAFWADSAHLMVALMQAQREKSVELKRRIHAEIAR